MTMPATPDYVLEQYEALRREALRTPSGRAGHGLSLLLTRGLPAWLTALATLAPPPPVPAATATRVPSLPGDVRAELTTVLAGMVLACAREGAE